MDPFVQLGIFGHTNQLSKCFSKKKCSLVDLVYLYYGIGEQFVNQRLDWLWKGRQFCSTNFILENKGEQLLGDKYETFEHQGF